MNRQEFMEEIELTFKECMDIVRKKNQDYAKEENPFNNFSGSEINGITTVEIAMLVRMQDKWSRMINLIHNKEAAVKDERLEDTIEDFINYLAILKVYMKSKANK